MLNRRREQTTNWRTSVMGLAVIMLSIVSFLVLLYFLIVAVKLLLG